MLAYNNGEHKMEREGRKEETRKGVKKEERESESTFSKSNCISSA
jgi:hypothetical protein